MPPHEAILKPQRVSVLLNASSCIVDGAARDRLRAALEAAFETYVMAASLEFLAGAELRAGAERALQSIKRGERDAVIVGGGDGSISTVAGVLAGSGVPLGVIPLGTLNHFAKDLKIPLAVVEAVAVIAAGATRPIDVGEVNGLIFINNSSIGFYPYLVLDRERQRRRHGLPKWLAMIAACLRAVRHFPLRRLTISAEGWTQSYRSPCVFVGNNEYRHSFGLPSAASLDLLMRSAICGSFNWPQSTSVRMEGDSWWHMTARSRPSVRRCDTG